MQTHSLNNNNNNDNLKEYYYTIKKIKNCNIDKLLKYILESKNSYWNYRCALLCMTEKRIQKTKRTEYVIKHAEIIFENNDLELIIAFLNKISNKPEYQSYIEKKPSILHFKNKLENEKKEKKHKEEKRQNEITHKKNQYITIFIGINNLNITENEKSELILNTDNPEINYNAIIYLNINKEQKKKHLQKILESNHPYWNYKCIKYILNKKNLSQKEKEALLINHITVVFNSTDFETIDKLSKILSLKSEYKKYINKRKIKELK